MPAFLGLVLSVASPLVAGLTAEAGHPSHKRRLDGLTAGTQTLTGSLYDTGCYKPVSEGGWGFCGPLSCNAQYVTCNTADGGGPPTVADVTGTYGNGNTQTTFTASTCQPFMPRTTNSDITTYSLPGSCDSTCTQQTTGVCSASFLANVIKGDGVKYAYCNDRWLNVVSDGSNGNLYTYNLNDVPFPPGDRCGTALSSPGPVPHACPNARCCSKCARNASHAVRGITALACRRSMAHARAACSTSSR